MNVLQQTLKMYKAFLHHGPVFLKNQISRDTSAQRFYQTRLTYYAIYLYVMPSAEAPPYIYKELYSACWCDLVKVVWAKDSQNSLLCACDDDTLTDCERLNVLTSCQADYPAVCGDGRDLPTYADELWEREIESSVDSLGNASQTILPLLKIQKSAVHWNSTFILFIPWYIIQPLIVSHTKLIKPCWGICPEYHFTAAVSTDFHKTILIIIEKNLIAKRHNVKQAVKTFRISPVSNAKVNAKKRKAAT